MRRISAIAVALVLCASWSHAQAPVAAAASKLLPATRGAVLSSIQGSALNSMNGSMADTFVRLRDARYGRIVNSTLTDKQGVFVFRGVDPGNYVVEVMNPANNAVLASSQMLNVNTGEAISALVKMPFRIPPIAGLLGNSTQTTAQAVSTAAQAVTAAAASSNTVAQTLAGEPSTSNTSNNAR
ncbi:MAG TPA: hypothetical protein VN628_03645 [Vicinamibacterales bacterium]|nr:hypothetical protein [Vicinamibacterales bacterium]